MNKKQKEKLYNGGNNLTDGFKNFLSEVSNDYEFDYNRLDTAKKLAYAKIEKEYAKKRKVIEKKERKITSDLKNYLEMVEKYSTFKINKLDSNIMDILAEITSLFKGEKYDWNLAKKHNKSLEYLMIFPETMDVEYEENVDSLIKDGIVLDFSGDYLGEDEINFYEADTSGTIFSLAPMHLKISDNSEKHKFILEFIDFVVKYRIEKKSDNISFVELKKLEQIFIFDKKEELEALNRKRAQKEREELERKIEFRDALLHNYIDDNFDDYKEVKETIDFGDVQTGRILKKLIERLDEEISE